MGSACVAVCLLKQVLLLGSLHTLQQSWLCCVHMLRPLPSSSCCFHASCSCMCQPHWCGVAVLATAVHICSCLRLLQVCVPDYQDAEGCRP